jgi:hypothetical protein
VLAKRAAALVAGAVASVHYMPEIIAVRNHGKNSGTPQQQYAHAVWHAVGCVCVCVVLLAGGGVFIQTPGKFVLPEFKHHKNMKLVRFAVVLALVVGTVKGCSMPMPIECDNRQSWMGEDVYKCCPVRRCRNMLTHTVPSTLQSIRV